MESSNNSSTMPEGLSFGLLEEITKGFSQMLGSGGYGEVYKGAYNGEEVAVKKLYYQPGLDDSQFRNEFNNLMRVCHQNIVRLLGYCYEIKYKHIDHHGEYVFGKMVQRVLCFEFLPASLDKHLYEESSGHDWPTRYRIIKGICEGLNYLHGGLNEPIFHLDLKPANILLDKYMIPKIADFGLSRLFRGTKTLIATACIGTENYMPPEYILNRKISEKYDVYSLGVIIIQIMTGPQGYSKYGDASSPQKFIEMVHNNWTKRIDATPVYNNVNSKQLQKDHCQQVKKCIEIAMKCVEQDKGNRPTIAHITHELNREKHGQSHEAWLAKFGPWGGDGGRTLDILVPPRRLKSVTIYSSTVIDSLTFSYSDHSGHKHRVGPWGGVTGKLYTIHLGQSEFLVEISGTTGPYGHDYVVTSLTILSNERRYGPFGQVGKTPFRTATETNGSIVGFFGRAGWYLDAIGVYVNPNHVTLDGEEVTSELQTVESGRDNMADLVKIGPWGRIEGRDHDMKLLPHRLESMTICSGAVIDSIAFSYSEVNGQMHNAGPWGNPARENKHMIQIGPSEFLTGVSGTVGPCNTLDNVITSLKFVTNRRVCGPFGQGGGTPFEAPMPHLGIIVGFFAHAEFCVEALGVYARHQF